MALPAMYAAVEIIPSPLRPGAAVLGAGAMVVRHVLEVDLDGLPEKEEVTWPRSDG